MSKFQEGGEEKQVFSPGKIKIKTYTNASKTACDKLKYLAPKRHKSSCICILSPCLRVKKTPNKDPSKQG